METKINEKLLEKKLSGLKKESSWNPGTIDKLESLIRSGDDFPLFRINPLKFGIDQNIPESEVIDVFLYSARAGILGLIFHDLRHSAATRMIESGVNIVEVSKILGHSDIRTTMRYAHPDDSLREAVEKLALY